MSRRFGDARLGDAPFADARLGDAPFAGDGGSLADLLGDFSSAPRFLYVPGPMEDLKPSPLTSVTFANHDHEE